MVRWLIAKGYYIPHRNDRIVLVNALRAIDDIFQIENVLRYCRLYLPE